MNQAATAAKQPSDLNLTALRLRAGYDQGDWAGDGRTMHLVDIENLLGERHCKITEARDTLVRYLEVAQWRRGDQTFVAGQGGHLLDAMIDPPVPFRGLLAYRGKDGADRRLLEVDSVERVARRYQRVVIGSGDGGFTGLAARLADLGVMVWVVIGDGDLAVSLRLAAQVIVPMPVAGNVIDLTDGVAERRHQIDLTDRGTATAPWPDAS